MTSWVYSRKKKFRAISSHPLKYTLATECLCRSYANYTLCHPNCFCITQEKICLPLDMTVVIKFANWSHYHHHIIIIITFFSFSSKRASLFNNYYIHQIHYKMSFDINKTYFKIYQNTSNNYSNNRRKKKWLKQK